MPENIIKQESFTDKKQTIKQAAVQLKAIN